MFAFTAEHSDALRAFRYAHGRTWKRELTDAMLASRYPHMTSEQSATLQRLRNTPGFDDMARELAAWEKANPLPAPVTAEESATISERGRECVPHTCETSAQAAEAAGDYRDAALWWRAGAMASAGHNRRDRYREEAARCFDLDAVARAAAKPAKKKSARAPLPTLETIENVSFSPNGAGMSAALSCEFAGARYHVWVHPQTLAPAALGWDKSTRDTLYKNPPEGTKTTDPGYYPARRLDIRAKFGAEMLACMRRIARRDRLREKAEDEAREAKARAESEERRRAWDARVSKAGPELLAALRDLLNESSPISGTHRKHAARLVDSLGVRP